GPPRWLGDTYRQRPGPERARGDWLERFDEHRSDFGSESEFGAQKETTHEAVRAGYYGSIEFIDLQLNRLRETLSDQGLLEDTVIAVVSDHGDMMGDHDMYRKSGGYEGSARVPRGGGGGGTAGRAGAGAGESPGGSRGGRGCGP